jgi:hypothetical protein
MTSEYTPQFWLSAAQLAGNILLGIYVWYANRQKATRAEFMDVRHAMQTLKDNHAKSCGQHLARTATLEERTKNAPTHLDMGQVHDRITSVKGGVDELKGMIKGVTSNVNLLVEHHLRGDVRI